MAAWASSPGLKTTALGLFHRAMFKLSQLTWPQWMTADVTLLAIRFNGNKPMIGYPDRDVFHIIGFDRDFSCYKHSISRLNPHPKAERHQRKV